MENQQILDSNFAPVLPETDGNSLEQKCLEFAQTLGLDQPVSVQVLEAALRDETYAHNLLVGRRSPAMMKVLLANPPKQKSAPSNQPQFSNVELIQKAATALLRWGKVGFSVVDQATLERRRTACMSCPNLSAPPEKLVYKLAQIDDSEKICSLCGCNVRKKVKLPSEFCPDRHPEQAGLNRWGEAWKEDTGGKISAG